MDFGAFLIKNLCVSITNIITKIRTDPTLKLN